jgi:pyrimidine operon attenuation protein / uracil phosphoribosyltransferase
MTTKKYILSALVAEKKLKRMALEVVERNYTDNEILLIGIKENGIVIANIIAKMMKDIFDGDITVVALSMDKKNPKEIVLEKEINADGKTILLIDDVANSGRTMLYALKPLLEKHPKKIQTLALVERTHKNFPVDVDYVGLSISTTLDEHIYVEVQKGKVVGAWVE